MASQGWPDACFKNRVGLRACVDQADTGKRTRYRRTVRFHNCAHPFEPSRPQLPIQNGANQFGLLPWNVVLARPQVIAGGSANDFIGKKRNQVTTDPHVFRARQLAGHLPIKRASQIRAVGESEMTDRSDSRIHLQEPSSIRGIHDEIEANEAGQVKMSDHTIRGCRISRRRPTRV